MRLFVAIDLDARVRAAVAEAVGRFRRDLRRVEPSVRVTWVAADRLHLTLHFLGEVDEAKAAAIRSVLIPPLPARCFQLSLGSAGVFPDRGLPRVIWIGIAAGGSQVRSVHRELGDRLAAAGCAIDVHPWSPHLTLGRVRTPWPGLNPRMLETLQEESLGEWLVDHVTLYESRLRSEGPVHLEILRTPLPVAHPT